MNYEEWKESLVIGKNPCYRCRQNGRDEDGDNYHHYSDEDGGHCYACGYTHLSDEYKIEYGIEEIILEEYEYMATEFNQEIHNRLKENTGVDGKGYRGIRTDISKQFGVRYEYKPEDGSVDKVFYPCTKGSLEVPLAESLVGYKCRKLPKTFLPPVGLVDKSCDLFMQFKFATHRGILIICEGEEDALSAYQMLYDNHVQRGNKDKYDEVAVVSGLTGAGGIVEQLKGQYDWLNQFQKIIICMDNDAAGKKATEKIVQVLPRGKAFTMNLRFSDPNEYLQQGKEREFISDFWGHRPHTPDGIKSSVEGFSNEELGEELLKERLTFPPYMNKMQSNMGGGLLQGRIVNIIAATGAGKTTHLRNIVYHFIFNSPVIPTIVSLEETAAQYSLGLLQVHLGENFMFGRSGKEVFEMLQEPRYQKAMKELKYKEDGTPRFYIIDERSGDIGSIEEQMEEMYRKYGSRLYINDVLSDMLRGSNAEKAEDHMNFQKNFTKEGNTIINVLHTIKIPLGADGKQRKVTEFDALGTGSYVQSAAVNIVFNRDKVAENCIDRNTTEVELVKCRGGITGHAGDWYFDFNTQRSYDKEDYLRDNPHLVLENENE